MSVLKSVLLVGAFLLISNGMQAQSGEKLPDTNKRMPFEHGTYEQVINVVGKGNGEEVVMKITQTVYFAHWGDWVATEFLMEISELEDAHHLLIFKEKTYLEIDLIEKTGRMREFTIDELDKAINLGSILIAPYLKKLFGEAMEIKKEMSEEYLGYTCKKTHVKYVPIKQKNRKQKKKQAENAEITALTYDNGNFPMKTDMKLNIEGVSMEMSSKITSINLDAPPASVFEVPDDVEIIVVDFDDDVKIEEAVEIEE